MGDTYVFTRAIIAIREQLGLHYFTLNCNVSLVKYIQF